MARILVAGGLFAGDTDSQIHDARQRFRQAIGREIIMRGHVLLGGCRTSLDAEGGLGGGGSRPGKEPRHRVIRSWVTRTTTPTHSEGEVVRSRMGDWSKVPRGFQFPEPIQDADVIIIIGGWDGTHYAASWGRLANRPIVPVATFGLAAAEIFDDELASFDHRYATRISVEEFQTLNRILPSWNPEIITGFAKDVVSLAERLIRPTDVFVIMSLAEKGHLVDA